MRWAPNRRVIILVAGAALIGSCGDAEPAVTAPPAVTAAARRVRTAPVANDETVALAVDRLLGEWRDPPEARSREDVVADLAALGLPGFEHLLQALGPDDEFARDLDLQELIERLGPPSLDVTARAIASTGRLRLVGIMALGNSHTLRWPFDERGPAVTCALLTALDDPNLEVRRDSLAWLGNAGPTGVPVAERVAARCLVKDPGERSYAFDALRNLGPAAAAAVPELIVALRRDGDLRDDIASVLASTGGESREARDSVLALLNDEDRELRRLGATAVAQWYARAPEVVPRLVALLHDSDEAVADIAREGLLQMARQPSGAKLLRTLIPELPARQASWFVAVAYDDEALALSDAAPRLLATGDPELRTATLRTLNDLTATPADASVLVPLLDDTSPAVRVEAALMLCWSGAEARARALAVAAAAASDADDEVRRTAASILASDAVPRHVSSELLALLMDPSDDVRRAAYAELAKSPDAITAPSAVLDAVIDSALRTEDQAAALVALRIEGGTDALVRAAAAALQSDERSRVRSALGALAAAGHAAVSAAPLIAPLMEGKGVDQEARLAYFEITGDVSALGENFDLDELDARRLLSLGDAGADAIVRWASRVAPWALAKMCADLGEDATLGRAIGRAAATPGNEYAAEHLRAGAAGLAPVLGPRRAVDLLVAMAADPSSVVRSSVGSTLTSLGDCGVDLGAATDVLGDLLRDVDADVRREAVLAARRLPSLRANVRTCLTDANAGVRLQSASALLTDADDGDARDALFEAVQHVESASDLCDADWRLVESALTRSAPGAAEAPVLATALTSLDDCSCQAVLLRALTRLGPDAAPALRGIRAALADRLPCRWGIHCDSNLRADAIAALAAMGPAARPAVPDLAAVAARSPEFAASARAAIAVISGSSR